MYSKFSNNGTAFCKGAPWFFDIKNHDLPDILDHILAKKWSDFHSVKSLEMPFI